MSRVYLLQHLHAINHGETEVKTLGVYSSRESADAAVERFRRLPGFRDTQEFADHSRVGPAEGFNIDEYELGQDSWSEGYATL